MLETDLTFIYAFIDILERLFEMIAGLFNSIGGGAEKEGE